MPLNYERLKHRAWPPVRQRHDPRDAILYALSLGLGAGTTPIEDLPFVWEGAPDGFRISPGFVTTLAQPAFWADDPVLGLDTTRLLHLEQRVHWHALLPPSGEVVGHTRITRVTDRGARIGAELSVERRIATPDGRLLAVLEETLLARGDGGYSRQGAGQPSDPPATPLAAAPLDSPPDARMDRTTGADAALLFRLLGDRNPLHVNPATAHAAGFPRPPLHGLASYGLAAHALQQFAAQRRLRSRLQAFALRFSAPVYPGDTMRLEIWRDPGNPDHLRLRGRVLARNATVLTHGLAVLA